MSQFLILFNAGALGVGYLSMVALLTKKSRIPPNHLLLAGFVFCYSTSLYKNFFLLDERYILTLHHFLRASDPMLLLTGPLFYLYVRNVLGGITLRPRDALFALPAAVQAVDLVPYYLAHPDAKRVMLQAILADPIAAFESMDGLFLPGIWALPFRLIYSVPFLLLALRIYLRHRSEQNGLAQSSRSLMWLGLLLTPILLFMASNVLNPGLVSLMASRDEGAQWIGAIDGLLVNAVLGPVLLIFISSLVLLNPETLFIIKSSGVARVIRGSEFRERVTALDSLFREHRVHLDPQLRLADVAGRLDAEPSQLSHALNTVLGENFNAYVNRWRVQHAKECLDRGDHLSLTIAGIGQASGFASQSSFYKAFKRMVGMTPSDYLERNRRPLADGKV